MAVDLGKYLTHEPQSRSPANLEGFILTPLRLEGSKLHLKIYALSMHIQIHIYTRTLVTPLLKTRI